MNLVGTYCKEQCKLDLTDSGQGPTVGLCYNRGEPLGSITKNVLIT